MTVQIVIDEETRALLGVLARERGADYGEIVKQLAGEHLAAAEFDARCELSPEVIRGMSYYDRACHLREAHGEERPSNGHVPDSVDP